MEKRCYGSTSAFVFAVSSRQNENFESFIHRMLVEAVSFDKNALRLCFGSALDMRFVKAKDDTPYI